MARPERHDADYFPFYAKDGRTLFLLQSHFGLEGIGFFTNLFRFLTLTPDHHICIQEESDQLYLFAKIGIEVKRGLEMIELMAKTSKIDAKLWQEKRVIVSEALLESLTDAYRRRSNNCITIDEIRNYDFKSSGNNPPKEGVSSDNNPVSVCIPPAITHKGKERKGKETNIGADGAIDENGLFHSVKETFESKYGRFENYGKEGKAIKGLIEKVTDLGLEPDIVLPQMIAKFYKLTQDGDKFWRSQPFLPSALNASGIWARVKVHAEGKSRESPATDKYLRERGYDA